MTAQPTPGSQAPSSPRVTTRVEAIVIAASTGGPEALAELLGALPATLPVPVLVAQHMPPMFTRLMAARLDAQCGLSIAEAVNGDPMRPGQVLLAPGDHHLAVRQHGAVVSARVDQAPPENSCRPSADVLLRSAADVYGSGTLALVLTGMGRDGWRGCERIRAAGGHVLVQDEASSVVWGMPGAVARAGLANAILPLSRLAGAVLEHLGTSGSVQTTSQRG